MRGTTDYRTYMAEGLNTLFFVNITYSGGEQSIALGEKIFESLIRDFDGGADGAAITNTDLAVASNRSLNILQSFEGVCRVHFDDICKANLGASNYRIC